MNKKEKLYLNSAFLFIIVGSLWFLTNNINDISSVCDSKVVFVAASLVRELFELLRTLAYIALVVVSFIGILKNKKMPKIYFITFVLLSYHTIVWIPEFFEYIVSLFKNMDYVMTKFFAFTFTVVGDIFFFLYKKNQLTK